MKFSDMASGIFVVGLAMAFVAYLSISPKVTNLKEEVGVAKKLVLVPTQTGAKLRMVVELESGKEVQVSFSQSQEFKQNAKVRISVQEASFNMAIYHFVGYIPEPEKDFVNNDPKE